VTKDQGGPPTNSGPVAIASGMPVVMIDSPVFREVFGPPDNDIIVVNRGSKRGRTGLKFLLYGSTQPMISNQIRCRLCLASIDERNFDWEAERASCCSLEFVWQLHRLALLGSTALGFIHSELRNCLGQDAAEKLVLGETNYLQFTVNAI
jgi:hypothetical protein